MSIIDENRFFSLSSDQYSISKTINGGYTWVGLTSYTGYSIYGICFVDASTGFHVGDIGRIFKTTNGGMTWSQLTTGTTDKLYSPFFVDKNTGFVLPNLKTTDGGLTWQKMNIPYDIEINSIYFIEIGRASCRERV